MANGLHPAEHRAYRELNAAGRQLIIRWRRIARSLEGEPIAGQLEGVRGRVEEMLTGAEALTIPHELSGRPAAQAVGAGLAAARGGLVDSGVDTGMVLRFAVLDVEHIATLLAQLAELARSRHDERMGSWCEKWAKLIRADVKAVRKSVVAMGADPERLGAPIDDSPVTRIAHRVGWLMGTVGEAFDRHASVQRRNDSR